MGKAADVRVGGSSGFWGLGIGLTMLIVPITLTLVLTGANEDRVPRYVTENERFVSPHDMPEAGARDPGEAKPDPLASRTGAREEMSAASQPSPVDRAVERRLPPIVVPVFTGFEHPRFQTHDKLIAKCVANFNAHRAAWAGSTEGQAQKISKITVEQVKAQMIQESGGQNALSVAAWKKDPLQVNVPGDWNSYKKYLGLHRPRNRNEGSLETNLKAGIMLLARKGFGESGQPAANRPSGSFDGWRPALQRYNGRKDLTAEGVPYRVAYANRILKRAAQPKVRTDIEIRKK